MKKTTLALIYLFSVALGSTATAKVYTDILVGRYKATFNLEKAKGQTFLNYMRSTLFTAISEQGPNQKIFEIAGVQSGEGVELRLSKNVSTFHVGYKAHFEMMAERSGRSFSGVGYPPIPLGNPGFRPKVKYVADASYSHYLTALERFLKTSSEEAVRLFYKSVLEIILNSDSSSVEQLEPEGQQVIADFVAVYVAEQYRRMTKGDGEGSLGRFPNWDDAHLQVTLLAAFHSGQSSAIASMFYEGRFTREVFEQINKVGGQSHCVYKQYNAPIRKTLKMRKPRLKDYTQYNKECARSGVNMTRRDFTALGAAITSELKSNKDTRQLIAYLDKELGTKTGRNIFDFIAEHFIDDEAPAQLEAGKAEKIIDTLVNIIFASREKANKITAELLGDEADPQLSEPEDKE